MSTATTVRILVLEDDPAHGEAIRREFKKEGLRYSVVLATTVNEFFIEKNRFTPALVIADARLPDGDVFDVFAGLGEMKEFPVLVMTSFGDEAMAVRVMKAGAIDYIAKSETTFYDLPRIAEKAMRDWDQLREREQLKINLQESRDKFRSYVENAPDGIFVVDETGKYVEVNPTGCKLTGYSEEELLTMSIVNIVAPESAEIGRRILSNLLATGSAKVEFIYRRKEGSHRWCSLDAVKLSDSRYMGFAKDIHERKTIEAAQQFLLQSGFRNKEDNFFEDLARYLGETLGAYYICIDRLVGDQLTAQTVAVYCNGKIEDNVEYALKDTPCGVLAGQITCCFPRNVCGLFPNDLALQELNAESYIGSTLWGFDGQPVGLIAIIDRQPMENARLAESLLKLVSIRAAGELERLKAVEALAEGEARYRAVIEQAPEAILLCDPDTGAVVEANSRFTELFGYDLRQGEPLTLFELIVDEPEKFRVFFDKLNNTGSLPVQRRICKHRNGTCLTVERSATLVSYRGRKLFVMTLRDVSDEVRREQAEYYQASHDELTGLYNRRCFVENVAKMIATGAGGALLLVDIDDFKLINDVHGHIAGDQYLVAFGAYLNENFGDAAMVARFGGDEFILFFAGPDGLVDATRSSAMMEVICLETGMGVFFVRLSGGIALVAEQETDLNLQIQRAYLALHHAKESGKWCCKTYEPALQDRFSRRYVIREALNQALANGEFRLVFQPIFDIREGAGLVGYEALLRWTSRQLGEVSPAEFIPVAEETNLILPIGKWVLQHACRLSANIGELYGECINVAVNISMRQLAMPNFVTMVKEILQETGLPACNLSLEVTESILMTDAATRISYLQELRDSGVSISLDDFGTGYSSFTYLPQLPITTLKIDKSMVNEISGGSSKSLLLLESLLQLSTLLGYRVIAEGVETVEQLNFLKSKGYSYCQGYLLGRPMEEAALLAMVGEQQHSDAIEENRS